MEVPSSSGSPVWRSALLHLFPPHKEYAMRTSLKTALLILTAIQVASLEVPTHGQSAETMKAVRIHAHGETSDVLHYEDAPKPSPKAGELLVLKKGEIVDWSRSLGDMPLLASA